MGSTVNAHWLKPDQKLAKNSNFLFFTFMNTDGVSICDLKIRILLDHLITKILNNKSKRLIWNEI